MKAGSAAIYANSDDHNRKTAEEEEDRRRSTLDSVMTCERCGNLSGNNCDGCDRTNLCSSCEDRYFCCVTCSNSRTAQLRIRDVRFMTFLALNLPKVFRSVPMPASYYNVSNPNGPTLMIYVPGSEEDQDANERETDLIRAMNADVAVHMREIYRLVDIAVRGNPEKERAWRDYKIQFPPPV